ncbi:hypothetical protein WJU23_09385 [Prosthecobacter sp. SYSU 5D2]|uniref:hypothetical protein n=1 Tax=Prosthecobacter sp. SYSU 5D2 TaxID=3134134 RepID=UPI0031FF3CF2
MKPLSPLIRALLPVLCLSLAGCDKVKTELAERDRNILKLNALIAENKELDENMAALKKAVPPDVPNGQVAATRVEQMLQQMQSLEQQLVKENQNLEKTAEQVKAAEKENESLRKRAGA